MIRFACSCGHRFELGDDQAGTSIQCPGCCLLTDVPTLSDLASFTEDGTYRVDVSQSLADDPDRLAELGIIYAKDKRDENGNEIDLRTLPGGQAFYDDDDEGEGELELKPRSRGSRADAADRPKYDPETGELIRALDVRQDERDRNPATIPLAKATLSYAPVSLTRQISPLKIAIELVLPINLAVMFFVLVAHVFNGIMFVVVAAGMIFLGIAWLILQALIIAHYGNVIDDTGRNDRDDLPRPLRDLDFYNDLWSPFIAMTFGLMIAFAIPILVLGLAADSIGLPTWIAWAIGAVVGTVVGPAVLLTTNLSGSSLNLRPDRVLQVIRLCGLHYVGATVLWAFAWPIYLAGWVGFCLAMGGGFAFGGSRSLQGIALAMVVLIVGIYLMHWFCWYLGLLYKAHHETFPWVLQRHIRDPNKGPRRMTHADPLRRRKRPTGGHLIPPDASSPPAPPPPPPPPAPGQRTGGPFPSR